MPKTETAEQPVDQAAALAALQDMVKTPGRLVITTAEHACGPMPTRYDEGRGRDIVLEPQTPDERARCEAYEFPRVDNRHYVLHNVTSIEPHPVNPDKYVCRSDEGDYTIGYPLALLKKLTEPTWYPEVADLKPEDRAEIAKAIVAGLTAKK